MLEGFLILGFRAHKGASTPSCPQCSLGEEGRDIGGVNSGLQEFMGSTEQDGKWEADWLKVVK